MGRLGCDVDGHLNESKFGDPIPWIGLYETAASAACALAMAIDAFYGLRNRKLWFPCKYFCLNATTLTLVTVATKLLVDLNTPMPRQQDQLAKLSSAVMICTVMGNFLPSLGSLGNKELLMNMLALGILITTAIINICIQIVTGVIYTFCKEHTVVMFLMLVLYAILVSSALTVPTTKYHFDRKYSKRFESAMRACSFTEATCKKKKLRDDLARFWMMAHTCSPQFVMGRLATSTASGAVCVLSVVVLAEANLRCILMPQSVKFCHGDAAYRWSSTPILVSQVVAITAGSIGPAFRWFHAITLRCPAEEITDRAWKPDFKVEKYWTWRLKLWKEYPLVLGIHGRFFRKLVCNIKDKILGFCIWMQITVVLFSKLIRRVSVYLVLIIPCCRKLIRLVKSKISNSAHATESRSRPDQDPNLRQYVVRYRRSGMVGDKQYFWAKI